MTDEHLRESLRRLPEAGAGEGFTRAVLARLAEETAGAEDPTAEPGNRGLGQRLRSFSLPAAAPRLAAAAAVMVVAATLALPLTPFLDQSGQPDAVAASVPATEGGMDVAGAPAERGAQPVAGPISGTDGPGAQGSETEMTGTEPAPAAQAPATEPRQASVTLPDAVPTSRPAAVPAASVADRAPKTPGGEEAPGTRDTAVPGEGRARDLDPEERRRAVERLRQLRREQEQLRTRLAALTERPAPTLVLGGDESLELVLDLNADAGPPGEVGGYDPRPASYRPEPEQRRDFH